MSLTFHLPPSVPLDVIQNHLADVYGLEGQMRLVAAERDQNLHVSRGSAQYLCKISSETAEDLEAQALALQHIAAVDDHLPVPRVVPSSNGANITMLNHEGLAYPVLLLTWLAGDVLADAKPACKNWRGLGHIVGRLNKALRGFVHPAIAQRHLVWDVMRADELLPHVDALPPEWRVEARNLLIDFQDHMRPRLRTHVAQILHGDVHPRNCLVRDGAISGIIDFGDMVHGPRILDVVAMLSDGLHEEEDTEKLFHDIVRGFNAVVPLDEEEADVIVALVKVRLLAAAIISSSQQQGGVMVTETIAGYGAPALAALQRLQGHESELTDTCRRAFGLTSLAVGNALERRKAAMGRKPLLFYSEPLRMLRGQGVWLHADDGRHYLDCYNNVAHVGHAHPRVAEAVARQMRLLNTNTRYLTDQSIAYAEALKATLDPSLDTVIFVNSGSEANDVAWRMANVWTGKRGALCMDFAYHGVTMAADALSPSNYPSGQWRFDHVRQIEAPDVYRGPFQHGDAGEAYAALCDQPINELKVQGHGLSIAILDSAFMTNGILDAPTGYVAGVVKRVRAASGLFIADEVQSGFGRMGSHMWGHQRHGVVPDFVTIGKPAGNGYPIGAIITKAEILERFVEETGPFFSTFGGGNVACAAGLAVLDVMREEDLQHNAQSTGNHFRDLLKDLSQRYEIIGDVRCVGLAVGVELVKDRKAKTPARTETRRVLDLMRNEGVLIGSDGKHGNVLKLRPPLVFDRANAEQVAATLDKVLEKL